MQTPSATTVEAQKRARMFYRKLCRAIPQVMSAYQLREITSGGKLRARLGELVREGGRALEERAASAGAYDHALIRAEEEYVAIVSHHYQRHHLITKFVNSGCREARDERDEARSAFLKDFLSGGVRELL